MIASENFVSEAVLEAAGSVFTNKYAEGYPGRRYYGGCEYADVVENLARDRAKQIFGAEHANVQPHSGSQANASAYMAVLQAGDTILGLDLAHGGHLTHGHKLSFSGKLYRPTFYHVRRDTETIDYDELEAIAEREKPKAIIGGAQRVSAAVGFCADAADRRQGGRGLHLRHGAYRGIGGGRRASFAGAACAHHHDHDAQDAARAAGGIDPVRQDYRWARSRSRPLARPWTRPCFPGSRAARWCTLWRRRRWRLARRCGRSSRRMRRRLWRTRRRWPEALQAAGYRLVSGGTDNHLLLVDVFEKGILGSEAELALGKAGITVNKNAIPYDTNPPLKPSGIRIGTPALTTRGMKEAEMRQIARVDREGAGAAQRRCGAGADSRRSGRDGESVPAYAWRRAPAAVVASNRFISRVRASNVRPGLCASNAHGAVTLYLLRTADSRHAALNAPI